MLAAQWLATPEPGVRNNAIDYIACLLVHDPHRGTRVADETVADHLYEVRTDRSMALID